MKAETMRFLIMAVIYSLAIVGASILLTGCESAKYVECIARDNTRNPCN